MANMTSSIQLEDLARECGLSRSMLLLTGTPIAEISRQLGFADQSHFTRAFGRARGLAPALYRRRRG